MPEKLSSEQQEQCRAMVHSLEECAAALRRCQTREDVELVLGVAAEAARSGVTLEHPPESALGLLHTASQRLRGIAQRKGAAAR